MAKKGDPVIVAASHSYTMVHGSTTRHEGYYIARAEKTTREGFVKEVRTYKGDIAMSYNGRGLRYERVFLLDTISGDDAKRVAEAHSLEWDDLDELKNALRPYVKR